MPVTRLSTDEPGKIYVAFRKTRVDDVGTGDSNADTSLPTGTFSNVLKFTSKEIDPSTNEPEEDGFDDEYEVAEFDLSASDYVVPMLAASFSHVWEQVGAAADGEEVEETLSLSSMKSISGE